MIPRGEQSENETLSVPCTTTTTPKVLCWRAFKTRGSRLCLLEPSWDPTSLWMFDGRDLESLQGSAF